MLGEYSQAYLRMLAYPTGSLNGKCIFSSRQPAFLDPNIGDFCLMLAAKTTMKNAIGEQNAASLSRWAILMRATALSRCGLPVSSSILFLCFLKFGDSQASLFFRFSSRILRS